MALQMKAAICAVLSLTLFSCCSSLTLTIPTSPVFGRVGGDVTLNFSLNPSNVVLQAVTWRLNSTNNVVTCVGAAVSYGQGYEGRANLNAMTGSLSLFRLTLRDSGLYSVSILTTEGGSVSGSVTLQVLDYSITPSPIFGQSSDNVTFDVSIKPTNMVLQAVTWTVNITNNAVIWTGGAISYGQGYEGRAHLNTMTGSLSLFRLTLSDSGQYNVTIITTGGASMTGNITLKVLDPVAVPKIQFNDAVTLSCMASGSDVSYQWFNGSSEVLDTERILLSVDRKTLMISRVVRSDDGPFYCYVYNNVSNSTSKPFNLGWLSVLPWGWLANVFLNLCAKVAYWGAGGRVKSD
ncbi:T-lymphocyte surface antigen Ly-9-like [Polypterus senegalus]|uniref:T-lymphocyte surface antigen Ly-9-like n=1 Tax=Polypterus senegalus TaxID=55291 RepID=UPI0019629E6F|nr:T-lymphocyte surface antigen Ly-9-like [Polypterus senegalus]